VTYFKNPFFSQIYFYFIYLAYFFLTLFVDYSISPAIISVIIPLFSWLIKMSILLWKVFGDYSVSLNPLYFTGSITCNYGNNYVDVALLVIFELVLQYRYFAFCSGIRIISLVSRKIYADITR